MGEFDHTKRIVIKIGSQALTHSETGLLDYVQLEHLVKELCNLKNTGRDVCLVSSGAVAVGRQTTGNTGKQISTAKKQAIAAVGQARLMSIYQRTFSEFNQIAGQVLMTKDAIMDSLSRQNAKNTFEELFSMDVIPVVNANDTISTFGIQFDENDTLSALVATLVGADLLIILTDIDGLYSSDPKKDPFAMLIPRVENITEEMQAAATDRPGSDVGTGGMKSKLRAARISTAANIPMVISNASDLSVIHKIFGEEFRGTIFNAKPDPNFDIIDFIRNDG